MEPLATEALAPAMVASLARQMRQLQTRAPEGVRLIITESGSLSEIVAEIDGPVETPYVGGVFRLKLMLGNEYPAAPPKGYFSTRIFHPNVALAGDICVNTLKRDWTPETTLSHILQVIRCLLIVPFPESSLNDEAGKLFMESYDEYFRKAKLWTSIHATPIGRGPASVQSIASAAAAASAASAASLSSSSAASTSTRAPSPNALTEPLRANSSSISDADASGGSRALPDKRKPAGTLEKVADDKKKKSLRRL